MERTVRDKVVVDIGTGKEAILARIAIEAGARKVYAIEKGDEAFAQAVAHIQELGLGEAITIIHGEIPEGQGAQYEKGWRDHYLAPMQKYFAKSPSKPAARRPAAKKAAAKKKAAPKKKAGKRKKR